MKKKLEFHTGQLSESTERILNPGRGWYTLYSFDIDRETDEEELRWCLHAETLALVMVDFHAYRDRKLDEKALQRLTGILRFFCEAGKDVIFRPVYDNTGDGQEHEPQDITVICQHLTQICEILQHTDHSVIVFQGLMLGSWGEMHTSAYLQPEHMKRLYECIRPCLDEGIYLAVRTPLLWRQMFSEEEYYENKVPVSMFDDALFSSASDMGTFGTCSKEAGWHVSWIRDEELKFMNRVCQSMPAGGEVVSGDWQISEERLIREMKKMHLGYLNSAYDEKVLNEWKQSVCHVPGVWKGCSLYDYIGEHLGYRFAVQTVQFSVKKGLRRRYQLTVTVQNTGFGVCTQAAGLGLICDYGDVTEKKEILADIRTWMPGETQILEIPVTDRPCAFYLSACRKKDGRIIRFANTDADRLYLGSLR